MDAISRMHILVIDDNPDDRALAIRAVSKDLPEATFAEVNDADSLEKALESDSHDVVITDYALRWTDGITVLRRCIERRPDKPVIMFTNTGNEEVCAEAMKSGLSDYILKSPKHYRKLPLAVRNAMTAFRDRVRLAELTARELDALRHSEQRFRQLVDTLPQIVWMALPGGETDYFNRRWYEYVGGDVERFDGQADWERALHVDDVRRTKELWEKAIGSSEPFEAEFRLRRQSDGAYRWFIGRALPLIDSAGVVERWYGSCTDIHDRRLAEHRAKEEAHVIDTINDVGRTLAAELDLQAVMDAVVTATTDLAGAEFGALFYNSSAKPEESLTLTASAGKLGDRLDHISLSRLIAAVTPLVHSLRTVRIDDLESGGTNWSGLAAALDGRDDESPIRSYLMVPIASRTQEVLGGLVFGHRTPGVFNDRSERLVCGIATQASVAIDNARLFDAARRANIAKDALLAGERSARSDAETANRMKDEFLSVVSHELRTPLNAILGWSHILRANPKAGDVSRGLDVIERNTRAQVQIIEDLLDMSRIISGKVRLDIRTVDVAAVIAAAVETLRPAADAKGIRLVTLLDSKAGAISGDPDRLQQVIWNLMSNAIKFTPKGGRIRVMLQFVESHLEISVMDSGEGIDPQFLPFVFERFRQADASTTRRYGGLGLGLSIVKNIVELHGGSVTAESPGKGRGSVFTINIPLPPVRHDQLYPRSRQTVRQVEDPAKSHEHHRPAQRPGAFAPGLHVLVVDDEADSRELLVKMLKDCDAQGTPAASTEEAVRLLQSGPGQYKLLVSDIGMPDRDGFDLIRTIRKLPPEAGGRIPAIALTAYARSDDRTRVLLAGFDMHVAKPVSPSELCAAISRLSDPAR